MQHTKSLIYRFFYSQQIVVSVGFVPHLSECTRWTRFTPGYPWFILPFCAGPHTHCSIMAASSRLACAIFLHCHNDSRQRADSLGTTLNRAEYLPLQRSLKFGLKTGRFLSLVSSQTYYTMPSPRFYISLTAALSL
jgi:hypothetical protein